MRIAMVALLWNQDTGETEIRSELSGEETALLLQSAAGRASADVAAKMEAARVIVPPGEHFPIPKVSE